MKDHKILWQNGSIGVVAFQTRPRGNRVTFSIKSVSPHIPIHFLVLCPTRTYLRATYLGAVRFLVISVSHHTSPLSPHRFCSFCHSPREVPPDVDIPFAYIKPALMLHLHTYFLCSHLISPLSGPTRRSLAIKWITKKWR